MKRYIISKQAESYVIQVEAKNIEEAIKQAADFELDELEINSNKLDYYDIKEDKSNE